MSTPWQPASGWHSKGKTLWRVIRYAGEHGRSAMEELNQSNGNRWFCLSYEAAKRKADTLNAESAT